MAEIELRRIRAGFYRCQHYCIHRGSKGWGVYNGAQFVILFPRLGDAARWCASR